MKELVAASLIAFNYISHKYQNRFKNLLFHIGVYAHKLELFYTELLWRWEDAAGKKHWATFFVKKMLRLSSGYMHLTLYARQWFPNDILCNSWVK